MQNPTPQSTPKGPRIIKKYPNRRLYDSAASRYITLSDIRQLVMDKTEFMVIDKTTREDITRSILLQVIAEQENGAPMMSQDFLSQVIRAYGGAMQNFVGGYLEHSLKVFAQHQAQIRERAASETTPDPFTAFATLAHRNLEFWQTMQNQFFTTMMGGAARKPEPGDNNTPSSNSGRDPA